MASSQTLPPLAPFPSASIRSHLSQQDVDGMLEVWSITLQAYLSAQSEALLKNESLPLFLTSFVAETSMAGPSSALGTSQTARSLYGSTFLLISRLLESKPGPELSQWEFLADASKLYTRGRMAFPLAAFFSDQTSLETTLSPPKKSLIAKLDAGLKTDLGALEQTLSRINHLLHASPDAAAFFLAGSDFLDGLISCYKIMNPPLRKVIIATTFLCLTALLEEQGAGDSKGKATSKGPKWGVLSDTLYSLLSAAQAHKAGPTSGNDSLVAELVSATPLLAVVLRRAEESSALTPKLRARIDLLQGFKKVGVAATRPRAKRRQRPRSDKGKGRVSEGEIQTEMHIHQMSQISVIQELFPDLGSGFVALLLDEYGDDVETVTARLLEDSLPPHLAEADRSAQLYVYDVCIHARFADDITVPPLKPTMNRFITRWPRGLPLHLTNLTCLSGGTYSTTRS
jgi:activating signal cointegrator complex subunit 2